MARVNNRASLTLAAVLILLAAGTSGCYSNKAKPGDLARWQHKLWPEVTAKSGADSTESSPKRTVADAQPRCLKDRLTADGLAADIKAQEASRGGSRVAGTWNGLNKALFSPAQGQFLSVDSGKWLLTDGMDFSSCTSVPCVLNTIRGNDAGNLEGIKAYWWYLRMGYVLSHTKKIPEVADITTTDVKAHMFRDEELNAFWKLSWTLADSYRNMKSLKTMHRVPTGFLMPGWGDSTCGDAWGNNGGWIRLADGCLDLPSPPSGFRGFLYLGVTHEMSHALDFLYGTGWDRYSESDEWKALSGWKCEDATDPTTGAASHECTWKSDPTADGFVRDYAATTPVEDWADTAAYFRYQPDTTLRKSPRKSAIISQKIWGGRTFDKEGLGKAYEDIGGKALDPQLLELVHNCFNGSAPAATGPAPTSHLGLDIPLPDSMVACLDQSLNDRVTGVLEQIRGTEYEACDYFQTVNEDGIRAKLFARVNPTIKTLVGQEAAVAEMLKQVKLLRAALSAQVDPREAYLHCYRQTDPDTCFTTALGDAFDHTAAPFTQGVGEMLGRERASYLDTNSIGNVRTKATEYFRQVFAGVDGIVNGSADSRWTACATPSAPLDSGVALATQPFTGGSHFVATWILNCINTAAVTDIDKVRDAFAQRLGITITDPDAVAFVRDMLLPMYVGVMNAHETEEAAAEDAERDSRRGGVIDTLVSGLVADTSWIGSLSTAGDATAACQPAAEAAFDTYFSHANPGLPLRFAALQEIRRGWTRAACDKAVTTSAITTAVNASVQATYTQEWNASMSELSNLTISTGQQAATTCRTRNPGATPNSKARRKQCVFDSWLKVEKDSLKAWDQTARGVRFATKRKDASKYQVSKRTTFQNQVIATMESGG